MEMTQDLLGKPPKKKKPKFKESKFEEIGTYRLSDDAIEMIEYANSQFGMPTERSWYRPDECGRDIGPGSWILVTADLPIQSDAKPGIASVYYATPPMFGSSVGYRSDGAYLVTIRRQSQFNGFIHEVSLYPHEYIVCTDEIMEGLIEEDLVIVRSYVGVENNTEPTAVDSPWMDRYKDLIEEDRNILDAYMLDGLTFDQASSMYFTERYKDFKGSTHWYEPKPELRYLYWR